MANNIDYAEIFQETLDEKVTQELLTGYMDALNQDIEYTGGKKVHIPKMSFSGLAAYDRANGYKGGSIDVEWEERTLTQDRGRMFTLDAMDDDETKFVASGTKTLDEFQRTMVVPEIDAYRISKLAQLALDAGNSENYVEGASVKSLINHTIAKLEDAGFNGQKYIHILPDFYATLEDELGNNIAKETFEVDGISFELPTYNGAVLIKTPSTRMYDEITILQGTEQGKDGGYEPAEGAKQVLMLVVDESVPIAVTKAAKSKVIDPDTNQDADAWKVGYRRYHDIWVADNKMRGLAAVTSEE